MRSLAELTATTDPAWPMVRQWLAEAPSVQVLPAERAKADDALLQLQVTLRSTMGAVVYHTGGLLIDHGWLRVLGSGSDRMTRSLPAWNLGKAPVDAQGRPTFVLVADDVLGGLFAVNGGALGATPGEVFYLAPDTLQWEGLSMGYTDFLAWALSPGLPERPKAGQGRPSPVGIQQSGKATFAGEFYDGLRWPGWQAEVGTLTGDQALSVYPFLWEEGPPIGERSRRCVPVDEWYRLTLDIRQQLSR